jgi:Holliday junction resolvase
MPHPSKTKGSVFEREVVDLLQSLGLAAERVPLSGAVKGGSFDRDVTVPIGPGEDLKLECKRRARAFSTLYALLGDNDAVIVRDDRTAPLIIMRVPRWVEIVRRAWR